MHAAVYKFQYKYTSTVYSIQYKSSNTSVQVQYTVHSMHAPNSNKEGKAHIYCFNNKLCKFNLQRKTYLILLNKEATIYIFSYWCKAVNKMARWTSEKFVDLSL